ncbi:MAG TPA: hypothetical protein VGC56_10780 [Allosphingosinicella sp.]
MEQEANRQAPEGPCASDTARDPALVQEAPAGAPAILPPQQDARTHPAFTPVPVRARVDGWTPARQRAFVEHLAETLSVDAAAALVGMTAQSARALRRRAGAEGFAAAWDAALRKGLGEQGRAAIIDEAVNGRLVRRYYHGELVSEERVRSPRLLLALLEKAEGLFAGPGAAESEACAADWQGTLDRLETGALEGGFRVWRDAGGRWWTSFPPPPGFRDHDGDPADPRFARPLSEAEEKALAARAAEHVAQGAEARDRFFGFTPRRGITYRRTRSRDRR